MCLFGGSHRGERTRHPPADRTVLGEDACGAPGVRVRTDAPSILPLRAHRRHAAPAAGSLEQPGGQLGLSAGRSKSTGRSVPWSSLRCECPRMGPASSMGLHMSCSVVQARGAELGICVTAPLAARGGVSGWHVLGLKVFQGKGFAPRSWAWPRSALRVPFHKHTAVCVMF